MNPEDMAERFRRELRRLLLVPMAALLLLAVVLGSGVYQMWAGARAVDRADRVIVGANRVERLMVDEETGIRGFLLSHDDAVLEPWYRGKAMVGPQFEQMEALTAGNAGQQNKLTQIRRDHDAWEEMFASRLASGALGEDESRSVLEGKSRMDRIRGEVDVFIEAEEELRGEQVRRNSRGLRVVLWSSSGLAVFLGVLVAGWLFKKVTQLNAAQEEQIALVRQRSEEVYLEQQWLRTTLRAIGDAVIATDAAGRVRLMNSVAEVCTGWAEAEAKDQPLAEVFRIVNETTREEVESPVDKVRRTGLACGLANHTVLIRKDGGEISIDDSGAPIRDSSGALIGIVLVFRDIDQRRRAERALEQSELRLRTLSETVPALIFIADASGSNTYVNGRFRVYSGMSQDALMGDGWLVVIHPEDVARAREAWSAAVEEGGPYDVDYRFRRADGVYCWFNVRSSPVRDELGKVREWFGVAFDITARKHAEEALGASEKKFRTLLEVSPMGVAMADAATARILYANDELTRILGYTREELERMTSHDFTYREDQASNDRFYERALQGETDGGVVIKRYVRKDGRVIWVQIRVRIIEDGARRKQVFGTIEDITESRKMQETLRENEQLFRSLFDQAAVGIAQVGMDGRWMRVNSRMCSIVGYTAEELEQRTFQQMTHPEDLESDLALYGQLKSGAIPFYSLEKRYVHKNGQVVWINLTVGMVRDESGEPLYAISVVEDITGRRLAEKALFESEGRFRSVADSVPGALFELETDGRVRYVNPWFVSFTGRNVEELGRVGWADMVHGEDRERVEREFTEAIASHQMLNTEMRILGAHGEYRWLHNVARPVRNVDGAVTHWTGAAYDISERRQAEAALLQSEKLAAVGRLASSIAHEINNPLESVTNLLFLAKGSEDASEIQGYLDTAERELRRASAITSQTLRFHKQSTSPKLVTCAELFESVLAIHQGRIINSRIEVEQRRREECAVLCFDGEVRQVLTNLMGNAIDAMHPEGGRLLIRSREATDWKTGRRGVAITIADSGSGMNEQVTKKIFDAFFTTKGVAGTGLGLWVCREIMDRHEGWIRVRSSQEEGHRGTAFALFLPFEAAARGLRRDGMGGRFAREEEVQDAE